MKSITSWLVVFMLAIVWIFRIIVTCYGQFGGDWGGFIVIDNTIEIAMLFISILCFILIIKRKALGGIIYLVGYGYYFGSYIISNVSTLADGETLAIDVVQNVAVGVIILILGLCAILDIAWEKTRANHFSDNKTDWYFKNKNYDRKYDDRADKNQYKTL